MVQYAVIDVALSQGPIGSTKVKELSIISCNEKGQPTSTFHAAFSNGTSAPRHANGHSLNSISFNSFSEAATDIAEILEGKILVRTGGFFGLHVLNRELNQVGSRFKPGKSIDLELYLNNQNFIEKYPQTREFLEKSSLAEPFVISQLLPLVIDFARDQSGPRYSYHGCSFVMKNVIRSL